MSKKEECTFCEEIVFETACRRNSRNSIEKTILFAVGVSVGLAAGILTCILLV